MSAAFATILSPYPGLRPFELEDYPVFFGRETQISAMLQQLEEHHFIAVVGSSGSGKSSLVRAGVLPALQEGFLCDTTDWLTLVIRPGHDPHLRLAEKIVRHASREPAQIPPAVARNRASRVAARLNCSECGLLDVLTEWAPDNRPVLVVVDQFEELFAFRRPNAAREEIASRDEAAAFVRLLLRAAADPGGRIRVIVTMRSDFIGDCEAFLGLPEKVSACQFLVPRLDRSQMEEAIRRPGEVVGAGFSPFRFETGLVNRIINDAGDRPDQLPLMQHALLRTWSRAAARQTGGPIELAIDDYVQAGGIDGALSAHADEALGQVDPALKDVPERLFTLLCDVSSEGKLTRRRPRVSEIMSVTQRPLEDIARIVRCFQADGRNFLVQSPPDEPLSPDSRLDISHEALVRRWHTFGRWFATEQRNAAAVRRLHERAHLQQRNEGGLLSSIDLERVEELLQRISPEWISRYLDGSDWTATLHFVALSRRDRKRKRMKSALFLYALIGLIATSAAGAYVLIQKAEKARAEAEAQKILADKATARAHAALTDSYVRGLHLTDSSFITLEEFQALSELASLGPEHRAVRQQVIQRWLSSGNTAQRALALDGIALQAAAGLDLSLRSNAAAAAGALSLRLLADFEALQQTNPSSLRYQGISVLASLAPLAGDADRIALAPRAAALFLLMMETASANDPAFVGDVGVELARLLPLVAPADRREFTVAAAGILSTTLGGLSVSANYERERLTPALLALAPLMSAADRQGPLQAVVDALLAALETDAGLQTADSAGGVVKSLPPCVALLPEPEASAAARRAGERLAKVALSSDHPMRSAVRSGLIGMATHLSPPDLAALAGQVSDAISATETGTPSDAAASTLDSLAELVEALAPLLPPETAAALSARTGDALVRYLSKDASGIADDRYLGDQLLSLSRSADPLAAKRQAFALLDAVGPSHPFGFGYYVFNDLLPVLLERADEPAAVAVADAIAADPWTKARATPRFVAALARRLQPEPARAWAAPYLVAAVQELNSPQHPEFNRIGYLAENYVLLAPWDDPATRTQIAAVTIPRLIEAIGTLPEPYETNRYSASTLALTIASLADFLAPADRAVTARQAAAALANFVRVPADLTWTGVIPALFELTARMNAEDAARTVQSVTRVVDVRANDVRSHLREIREASAKLREHLPAADLERVLAPAAQVSVQAIASSLSSADLWTVSNVALELAKLVGSMPSAREAARLALYGVMLDQPLSHARRLAATPEFQAACAQLLTRFPAQELTEILKWPFCVGDTQQAVLAELERKTGATFGGQLSSFIEQAATLQLGNLDGPAREPDIEAALAELKPLLPSPAAPGNSP